MLSDQCILTDSKIITVYTVEGSTMNLTFKFDPGLYFKSYRNRYKLRRYIKSEEKKYDIILRPNITEIQMKNVTANDTGLYWVLYEGQLPAFQLSISSMYIVTCCIFPTFSFCIR